MNLYLYTSICTVELRISTFANECVPLIWIYLDNIRYSMVVFLVPENKLIQMLPYGISFDAHFFVVLLVRSGGLGSSRDSTQDANPKEAVMFPARASACLRSGHLESRATFLVASTKKTSCGKNFMIVSPIRGLL